jgi:hypothetical protein
MNMWCLQAQLLLTRTPLALTPTDQQPISLLSISVSGASRLHQNTSQHSGGCLLLLHNSTVGAFPCSTAAA